MKASDNPNVFQKISRNLLAVMNIVGDKNKRQGVKISLIDDKWDNYRLLRGREQWCPFDSKLIVLGDQIALVAPELGVVSVLFEEGFVCARFDDFPCFEHHDLVRAAYGREAVRDDEHGALFD